MSVLCQVTQAGVERRHARRNEVESLLGLADHLEERDRLLVQQIYQYGLSLAALARLTGRSQRAVRGRIRKLMARMRSPVFGYVVLQGESLPARTRQVAEEVVVRCRSLRSTAAYLGMSLHAVREQMAAVRALATGWGRAELTSGERGGESGVE